LPSNTCGNCGKSVELLDQHFYEGVLPGGVPGVQPQLARKITRSLYFSNVHDVNFCGAECSNLYVIKHGIYDVKVELEHGLNRNFR